jgi:hypothetical protein
MDIVTYIQGRTETYGRPGQTNNLSSFRTDIPEENCSTFI